MKCFNAHEKFRVQCKKNSCKYWISCPTSYDCTLIAAKKGPMTLQQIGEIFNVTRMRICQLEKRILKKMNIVMDGKFETDFHSLHRKILHK
jgi:hypothetical protein